MSRSSATGLGAALSSSAVLQGGLGCPDNYGRSGTLRSLDG